MSEKKNHKILSFEEALKSCSKGSHQKVLWTCPKCSESGVRIFKSAIKIKLCKKCSGILQVASFDLSGEKNPWFKKRLPCAKSGPEHYMWKGGLRLPCADCGKLMGDRRSYYCKSCSQKGPRNHAYKPELTDEHRLKKRFNNFAYCQWAKRVKERDGFTCQKCFEKGHKLHSHHMEAWSIAPEKRFALENGITLCKKCHKELHSLFGNKVTFNQSLEYLSQNFPVKKTS